MHKHSKTHNKIVRHVLRQIAHQTKTLYPEIKKKFVVDSEMDVTMQFWVLLKDNRTYALTNKNNI